MKIYLSFPALVIAILTGCHSVEPTPPPKAPIPISMVKVPSRISIPIIVKKEKIQEILEKNIPKTIQGSGTGDYTIDAHLFRHVVHYWYDYKIDRNPLHISLSQDTIKIDTLCNGRMNARWDTVKGSAHIDTSLTLGVNSKIKLMPNYKIKSSTSPILQIRKAEIPVGFRYKHHDVGFTISIRGKLDQELRPKLNEIVRDVDSKLAQVDLRKPVSKAWKDISTTIPLNNDIADAYLQIKPYKLQFSGIKVHKGDLLVNIGLDTYFQGIVGANPGKPTPAPLPNLSSATGKKGLNIALPVYANYRDARTILHKHLANTMFTVKDNVKINIKDVNIYGNGKKVVVKVDFSADVPGQIFDTTGWVFLVGTPVYNPGKNVLSVTNFDYDLNTKNLLVTSADWLLHEPFVRRIQNELHWDYSKKIIQEQKKLNAKISNFKLSKDVKIKGNISSFVVKGIYTATDGIGVNAVFGGQASVLVR